MYCKYCGAELDDDARFCMKCGREVQPGVKVPPPPATSAPAPPAAPAARHPPTPVAPVAAGSGSGQKVQKLPVQPPGPAASTPPDKAARAKKPEKKGKGTGKSEKKGKGTGKGEKDEGEQAGDKEERAPTPGKPLTKDEKIKARKKAYTVATTGQRLGALIIDGLFYIVVWVVIFSGSDWFWATVIADFLWFFGLLLFEAFGKGQTLGKKILKMRSVQAGTWDLITKKQALVVCFAKAFLLPLDVILGLITKPDDEKNQIRFVQRKAHVVVVKRRK